MRAATRPPAGARSATGHAQLRWSALVSLVAVLLALHGSRNASAEPPGSDPEGKCASLDPAEVPHVALIPGLYPSSPYVATLAREHSRRALLPPRDGRLALVTLGRGEGAVQSALANWTDPAWAAGATVSQSARGPVVTAGVEPGRPYALGEPLPAGAATGDQAWNGQALSLAESAVLPLLTAHAAGNTSWLLELDAATAAGAHLPASFLAPPPGAPGGPAAAPLLLLFRRDWWRWLTLVAGAEPSLGAASAAGGAPTPLPPTWPLLVDLLTGLLGRDLDGDGRADHVLCADLMPGCKGGAVLAAIFASLRQSQGSAQGVWFSTADLSPSLGSSPAALAALRLYAALAAANAAPFTPGGRNLSQSAVPTAAAELLAAGGAVDATGTPLCGAVNPLFAAGRCLFTIDWAPAALRLSGEDVSGVLGAAPLPGSSAVMATAVQGGETAGGQGGGAAQGPQLLPCTPQRCPHATVYGQAEVAALAAMCRRRPPHPQQPAAGEAGAAAADGVMAKAPGPGPLLVNRAPLLGAAGNVWRVAPGQPQDALLRLDAFLGLVGYELDLKYGSVLEAVQPYDGSSSRDLRLPDSALGLDTTDLASLRAAVGDALSHPNAALDIQMPHSSAYRDAMDQLAASALAAAGAAAGPPPDADLSTSLEAAAERFRAIQQAFPYPAILRHLYWNSIGFVSLPQEQQPSDSQPASVLGIALGVSVGTAAPLLLSLGALLLLQRRRSSNAARGALARSGVKPPGPGPATTLALTDIQNSTLLWEVLSAELMDECMAIHHGVMRRAIEVNEGYEVFTEGDAFAVAFHGPDDAVSFAMDLQMELLTADWPPQLLALPDGCEVWARRATHLAWPPPLPAMQAPVSPAVASQGASERLSPQVAGVVSRIATGRRRLRHLILSGITPASQSNPQALDASGVYRQYSEDPVPGLDDSRYGCPTSASRPIPAAFLQPGSFLAPQESNASVDYPTSPPLGSQAPPRASSRSTQLGSVPALAPGRHGHCRSGQDGLGPSASQRPGAQRSPLPGRSFQQRPATVAAHASLGEPLAGGSMGTPGRRLLPRFTMSHAPIRLRRGHAHSSLPGMAELSVPFAPLVPPRLRPWATASSNRTLWDLSVSGRLLQGPEPDSSDQPKRPPGVAAWAPLTLGDFLLQGPGAPLAQEPRSSAGRPVGGSIERLGGVAFASVEAVNPEAVQPSGLQTLRQHGTRLLHAWQPYLPTLGEPEAFEEGTCAGPSRRPALRPGPLGLAVQAALPRSRGSAGRSGPWTAHVPAVPQAGENAGGGLGGSVGPQSPFCSLQAPVDQAEADGVCGARRPDVHAASAPAAEPMCMAAAPQGALRSPGRRPEPGHLRGSTSLDGRPGPSGLDSVAGLATARDALPAPRGGEEGLARGDNRAPTSQHASSQRKSSPSPGARSCRAALGLWEAQGSQVDLLDCSMPGDVRGSFTAEAGTSDAPLPQHLPPQGLGRLGDNVPTAVAPLPLAPQPSPLRPRLASGPKPLTLLQLVPAPVTSTGRLAEGAGAAVLASPHLASPGVRTGVHDVEAVLVPGPEDLGMQRSCRLLPTDLAASGAGAAVGAEQQQLASFDADQGLAALMLPVPSTMLGSRFSRGASPPRRSGHTGQPRSSPQAAAGIEQISIVMHLDDGASSLSGDGGNISSDSLLGDVAMAGRAPSVLAALPPPPHHRSRHLTPQPPPTSTAAVALGEVPAPSTKPGPPALRRTRTENGHRRATSQTVPPPRVHQSAAANAMFNEAHQSEEEGAEEWRRVVPWRAVDEAAQDELDGLADAQAGSAVEVAPAGGPLEGLLGSYGLGGDTIVPALARLRAAFGSNRPGPSEAAGVGQQGAAASSGSAHHALAAEIPSGASRRRKHDNAARGPVHRAPFGGVGKDATTPSLLSKHSISTHDHAAAAAAAAPASQPPPPQRAATYTSPQRSSPRKLFEARLGSLGRARTGAGLFAAGPDSVRTSSPSGAGGGVPPAGLARLLLAQRFSLPPLEGKSATSGSPGGSSADVDSPAQGTGSRRWNLSAVRDRLILPKNGPAPVVPAKQAVRSPQGCATKAPGPSPAVILTGEFLVLGGCEANVEGAEDATRELGAGPSTQAAGLQHVDAPGSLQAARASLREKSAPSPASSTRATFVGLISARQTAMSTSPWCAVAARAALDPPLQMASSLEGEVATLELVGPTPSRAPLCLQADGPPPRLPTPVLQAPAAGRLPSTPNQSLVLPELQFTRAPSSQLGAYLRVSAPWGRVPSHPVAPLQGEPSMGLSRILTAVLDGPSFNQQRSSQVQPRASATGYPSGTPTGDDVFAALFRDVNCAALAHQQGTGAEGPGVGADSRSNFGWLPRAAATVGSALQLLFDRLSPGDVACADPALEPAADGADGAAGNGTPCFPIAPELVLRGLRIRMGLHSGPQPGEVELSAVGGVQAARYTGGFLATAKEIADAAAGGMTVLSGSAFRAYQQLRRRARMTDLMLMHVGDHVIRPGHTDAYTSDPHSSSATSPDRPSAALPARELFAVVCPGLLGRLALLPSPVRTHREVLPGCLSAPAGEVAPVFCNVLGVESLLSWEKVLQERSRGLGAASGGHGPSAPGLSAPVATPSAAAGLPSSGLNHAESASVHGSGMVRNALELLRGAIMAAAVRHGGYVVASSSEGGHWVLVFSAPEQAVAWGLALLDAMLGAEWPPGFLEHELTEEEWQEGVLVRRGLRLRIGIDCGRAMVRLVPRTGRLDYVGRPLNRAARIAAKAKAASVLVSDTVWHAVRPTLGTGAEGRSLGQVQLKGVREPLELWAVRRAAGSAGS